MSCIIRSTPYCKIVNTFSKVVASCIVTRVHVVKRVQLERRPRLLFVYHCSFGFFFFSQIIVNRVVRSDSICASAANRVRAAEDLAMVGFT